MYIYSSCAYKHYIIHLYCSPSRYDMRVYLVESLCYSTSIIRRTGYSNNLYLKRYTHDSSPRVSREVEELRRDSCISNITSKWLDQSKNLESVLDEDSKLFSIGWATSAPDEAAPESMGGACNRV
jgi:hypothetical protein